MDENKKQLIEDEILETINGGSEKESESASPCYQDMLNGSTSLSTNPNLPKSTT
jgi:hypothetical protein